MRNWYQSRRKIEANARPNLTFLNGSTNFKILTLAEHRSTDSQQSVTEVKENEQTTIAGKSIPMQKVTLEVPADSAVSSGLKNMEVKKEALTKLHDVVHYIALKGRPFAGFKDLIDFEKLHGVEF